MTNSIETNPLKQLEALQPDLSMPCRGLCQKESPSFCQFLGQPSHQANYGGLDNENFITFIQELPEKVRSNNCHHPQQVIEAIQNAMQERGIDSSQLIK